MSDKFKLQKTRAVYEHCTTQRKRLMDIFITDNLIHDELLKNIEFILLKSFIIAFVEEFNNKAGKLLPDKEEITKYSLPQERIDFINKLRTYFSARSELLGSKISIQDMFILVLGIHNGSEMFSDRDWRNIQGFINARNKIAHSIDFKTSDVCFAHIDEYDPISSAEKLLSKMNQKFQQLLILKSPQ